MTLPLLSTLYIYNYTYLYNYTYQVYVAKVKLKLTFNRVVKDSYRKKFSTGSTVIDTFFTNECKCDLAKASPKRFLRRIFTRFFVLTKKHFQDDYAFQQWLSHFCRPSIIQCEDSCNEFWKVDRVDRLESVVRSIRPLWIMCINILQYWSTIFDSRCTSMFLFSSFIKSFINNYYGQDVGPVSGTFNMIMQYMMYTVWWWVTM